MLNILCTIAAVLLLAFFFLAAAGYLAALWFNLKHDRALWEEHRCLLGKGFWRRVLLGYFDFTASQMFASLTLFPGHIPYLLGRGEGADPTEDESGPPVILVHGLYHNPAAWMLIKPLLRRAGFCNLYVYGYNSLTTTYADLVHGLTLKMEEVLAEYPKQKVALVGHSLGGLVIRGAIGDGRFEGRIGSVCTLGTPHKGSELAHLGIGRLARQLRPEDPIFEQLAAQPAVEGIDKLSLFMPVDNLVFPTSLLKVDEPGWEEECLGPDVSHVGMIFNRAIAARVIRQLSTCREAGRYDA